MSSVQVPVHVVCGEASCYGDRWCMGECQTWEEEFILDRKTFNPAFTWRQKATDHQAGTIKPTSNHQIHTGAVAVSASLLFHTVYSMLSTPQFRDISYESIKCPLIQVMQETTFNTKRTLMSSYSYDTNQIKQNNLNYMSINQINQLPMRL